MSCLPIWMVSAAFADAVVGGRAGRRDRIVHALDLEPGGERRGGRRRHCLRHRERTDPLRALAPRDVGGLDHGAGGRAARAHDDAGALVGNLVFLEAGVAQGLLHGDVVPGRAQPEEPHGAAVDGFLRIEPRRTVDLAAEPELGVFVGARNAGFRFPQARQHLLRVVADGRDDAHPGDDDPPHDFPSRLKGVAQDPRERRSGRRRLERRNVAEQSDLEIECAIK